MKALGFLYCFPGWELVNVDIGEDEYDWSIDRATVHDSERAPGANMDGDQVDAKRPASPKHRKRRRQGKDPSC